jgi:hypothetical protein
VSAPGLARIDPATGAIAWTPTADGTYEFVVRLDNRVGADEQSFEIEVGGDVAGDTTAADTTAGDEQTSQDLDDEQGGGASDTVDGSDDGTSDGSSPERGDDGSGCGCRSTTPRTGIAVLLALFAMRRRRQPLRARPPSSASPDC